MNVDVSRNPDVLSRSHALADSGGQPGASWRIPSVDVVGPGRFYGRRENSVEPADGIVLDAARCSTAWSVSARIRLM